MTIRGRIAVSLTSLQPFKIKNKIVFYSVPAYTDNARALHDYIKREKYDIKYNFRIIWLTNKEVETNKLRLKGLNAYCKRSIRGMYHVSTAAIFAFSSLPLSPTDGIPGGKHTFKLFLMHGLPFKGPELDKNIIRGYCKLSNKYINKYITTSKFMSFLHAGWYCAHASQFEVTGYPRNDILLNPVSKERAYKFLEKIGINRDKYIIIYAPTFRLIYNNKYKKIKRIDSLVQLQTPIPMKKYEFNMLLNILRRENAVMIIHYHVGDEEIYKKLIYNKNLKNLFILTNDIIDNNNITFYEILSVANLLITDYSSIFYDFLLLDKPIIFYMYDLNEYYKRRGLIIEPSNLGAWLPGHLTFSGTELIEALSDTLSGSDAYSNERRRLRSLVHYYIDAESSRRVWERIIKPNIK